MLERPLTDDERRRIEDGMRRQLGTGFVIDVVVVDSIPLGASGKQREFVSELESRVP